MLGEDAQKDIQKVLLITAGLYVELSYTTYKTLQNRVFFDRKGQGSYLLNEFKP